MDVICDLAMACPIRVDPLLYPTIVSQGTEIQHMSYLEMRKV